MKIGMVGLGKMGGNMAERLRAAGHEVVGYDVFSDATDVQSLEELVAAHPVSLYHRGTWGPTAADTLASGVGGWHEPL